jgi:hypothetical protein
MGKGADKIADIVTTPNILAMECNFSMHARPWEANTPVGQLGQTSYGVFLIYRPEHIGAIPLPFPSPPHNSVPA